MRERLDLGTQSGVFARTLFFQSCWSYEGMQNLGLLYSLEPWLRSAYPRPEEYREAALRHLGYFNTHPYMAGFVTGVIGGMEERLAESPEEDKPLLRERIFQLKKAMGSALAAIGDALFLGALRPAFAAGMLLLWILLRAMGVPHPVLYGAAFFFIAYNAAAFFMRWEGLRLGYLWKEELPLRLKRYRWQEKILWVRRAGLCAALLVSAVELSTAADHAAKNAAVLFGAVVLKRLGISARRIYAAAALIWGLAAAAGGA